MTLFFNKGIFNIFQDKKIAELEESFNSKIQVLELQEKRLVRELDESKNQNKLQAQSISENKEITSNMKTEIGALKNQIETMTNAKTSSSQDQAKKDHAQETKISQLTGELSELKKNSHIELIQEKKKIDDLRSRIERGLTTISDLERKLVEKNEIINNFKKGLLLTGNFYGAQICKM